MSDEDDVPELIPLREDPRADPRLRAMFELAHRDALAVDFDAIADAAQAARAAPGTGFGAGFMVKIVAAIVVGSLVSLIGWWTYRRPETVPVVTSSTPSPRSEVATPSVDSQEPSATFLEVAQGSDGPRDEPASSRRRSERSHSREPAPPHAAAHAESNAPEPVTTPEPTTDPSMAEGTLLLRARRALGRDDPRAALALTREHEVRFANGRLASERDAIAIDALRALERNEEARARARALLARDPTSPYADRARSALHP